jgi:N-succinyldiaminopimelate aminotransferase
MHSQRTSVPISQRLRGFGTTIFTEFSALALQTGAVNLGQGFPDENGPSEVIDDVVEAMRRGENQYAPLAGVPALREAIAEHQRRRYGLEVDPHDGVQVTFGATEAISAALLGLLEPGDVVVLLEPYYDSYAAAVAMAGASRRGVVLRPPDFAIDLDALDAAAEGARALILNSPHNPTGRVLSRAELEGIAAVCAERDLLVVTDEVYEHLVFDGAEHVPLATLPGMAERTLTVSSAGKSFSFTGWKVGWCSGPPDLVAGARAAKQFLTFAGATPLQHAIARALPRAEELVAPLARGLRENRDRLAAGLRALGLSVIDSQGTYFLNVDLASIGEDDAVAWCRELPHRAGVVAIPTGAFYDDEDAGRTLARFAFCKRTETLELALERLAAAR